jgi:hypothetical protein
MLSRYKCVICQSKPDQLSHHKSHLKTDKHKNKHEILKLQLKQLPKKELKTKYGSEDIDEILKKFESKKILTLTKKWKIKKTTSTTLTKKKKTNKLIFEKSKNVISDTEHNESFKKTFLDFLGKMHNLLRGAGVTCEPALDDILNCLFLCYIEDKISDEGEFDLSNSTKSCYKGIISRKVKDYVKYLKVSYLLDHKEELRVKDGLNSIRKCAKILSTHPITKKLFKDKDFINCPDTVILSKLLENCLEFSKKENIFENIDITGIAYEYMTTKHAGNGGTSKEMGQYFTERPLMDMCFQLIDGTDITDLGINNNSTMGDEFCATFGFPLMARKFIKDRFDIDIQDKNMYGVEYHERLSKFAYMNAMFSMKNFKNITRGNSFITNVKPHLDISIHNVPFGKSMTPKNIETTYNGFLAENPTKGYPTFKEYIPFHRKKIDAILASQVVLFKTKKMALMIIKDGEETSGKSNAKYRKWFSENCIIKKIMKIPSGAFTCTGTKTVCIYFIKKKGKMTENIQFIQLSSDGNKMTEICKVSMDEMSKNNYSWDPNGYIIDEEMEKMMSKSKCEWKPLGEVCKSIKSGKPIKKENRHGTMYPYLGGGENPYTGTFLDKYLFDGDFIICAQDGSIGAVNRVNGKFWANNHTHILEIHNPNIRDYVTYYLKYCINYDAITSGMIPKLTKERLENINVPIIENIEKISKSLKDLEEQKQLLTERKAGIGRQMNIYFETQIKKNDVEIKELQQLIKINIGSTPSTKKNDYWTNGENVWISVSELNNNLVPITDSKKKLTNEAIQECKPTLVKKGTILMSFKLSIGKLGMAGCDLYTNEAILHINTNNDELNRYLYYHILAIPVNNTASGCMGGGSLNKEKLRVLNMCIQKNPEKQTEIVKSLDKLEAKKNSIDKEINDIDTLIKDVLEQSYN